MAMLGRIGRQAIAGLLIVLMVGIASCSSPPEAPAILIEATEAPSTLTFPGKTLSEVSPPELISELTAFLDAYEPQLRITTPNSGDILEDAAISVEVEVQGLPIYKDADLGLGPHVHLFLDDLPHQALYDLSAPIVLSDLAPGTHTLRAVAVRPWGESFKNAGAYDQVTFSIFASTPNNAPDPDTILLTYNQPQGSYATEPILLDFQLANAPLHLVAAADETVTDWRLRCTVNGESFEFDRWQPVYLKGFKPGKNWVKLEVLDEQGTPIDNAFNTALRVIDYDPEADDSLSRLIRGDIPMAAAMKLVDPNYTPPEPVEEEAIEEEPAEAESLGAEVFDSQPVVEGDTSAEDMADQTPPESLAEEDAEGEDVEEVELEAADSAESEASEQAAEINADVPEPRLEDDSLNEPLSEEAIALPEASASDNEAAAQPDITEPVEAASQPTEATEPEEVDAEEISSEAVDRPEPLVEEEIPAETPVVESSEASEAKPSLETDTSEPVPDPGPSEPEATSSGEMAVI